MLVGKPRFARVVVDGGRCSVVGELPPAPWYVVVCLPRVRYGVYGVRPGRLAEVLSDHAALQALNRVLVVPCADAQSALRIRVALEEGNAGAGKRQTALSAV